MSIDAANLVKWFQDRPAWMRDALSLLVANGALRAADIETLAERCRQQGVEKEDGKADSLPAAAFAARAGGPPLRLKSVSAVKGIEGLNPRAPLTFGAEPITIVYGHNGAGKSGYIRILNNVCGSKNRRPLLGNVFQGAAPQSCEINYVLDGADKALAWEPKLGEQAELAGLEIYDSEAGLVYVNGENEVAFEPWLLGLFQHLIDACGAIDRLLTQQIAVLVSAKPVLPTEFAGTPAAVWYAAIGASVSAAAVEAACGWTAEQAETLAGLQARLLEKNPADQAKTIRVRIAGLEKFSGDWSGIAAAYAPEAARTFLNAQADAVLKRKAASEDAAKVFAQAPLEGVGQESWKLLWDQARAYSETVAYPKEPFPVTKDGACCVLCHQPLDEAAGARLNSFERFVKGELESLAKAAEAKLAGLLDALPKIPSTDDLNVRLATLGLDDEAVATKLHTYRDALAVRDGSLRLVTTEAELLPQPDAGLLADLPVMIEALKNRATAFEEDAKKTDKSALKKQANELAVRKWLNEQKPAIGAEIVRLKKIAALDAARKHAGTTALSSKKAELAQQLVSGAFIGRFQAELKALSAARIQVELVQTRTTKGHVFHQVQLKGAKLKAPTSDVLSEGERRIVSIAAFLADVEGIEANTPFVFDDPISSLDQDFEESVVARLVTLAKKRQVIVFTHRLSMLSLLEEAGKAVGIGTRVVALNREAWGAGEPGETPFFVRSPDKVINALIGERLPKARKVLESVGRADYDAVAKGVCSEIRILTERMVEDTLLNQVVRRFRRSVQTQNRLANLAKINPADCRLIDEFMTKYSRYEHSQSQEAPVPLPEPDEIAADLVTLQTWLKEFADRKNPA